MKTKYTGKFENVKVRDVSLGKNITIIEPCNLYNCSVGDNSFIGPFVEIQKGVTIGKNCKIQSHSFICELVTISDDCTVAHGVMFINDKFQLGGPAKGEKSLWGKTFIGKGVSIGSNATILPVKICEGSVIGAGSVVTKDILQKGIYAGNPAVKIREL
ncbi:MAG: acyltransferase [Opitutales bacterium]